MATVVDCPQRPAKRRRRATAGETVQSKTSPRPSRSASTSTPARRNSITSPTPPPSFSYTCTPFTSSASAARLRSAADARALLLDPTYSGVAKSHQPRVFIDESGVEHDPDYRMFPPSPTRVASTSRRRSVNSDTFNAGSPFAGYVDFAVRYSSSAGGHNECDLDQERMDIDEDAESEREWSRLHASSPPRSSRSGTQEGVDKSHEDGYADFDGMEWDENEWMREEVVPTPIAPDASAPPGSAPPSVKSYPKPKSKIKFVPKAKAESVSSATATARGYVPAKRSYDESAQDEWTPSCGYSIRRHWQSFTLRIRFSVFRWRRRLRRVLAAAKHTE